MVTVEDGTIQSELLNEIAKFEGRKIVGGVTSLEHHMQVIHTFRNGKELNANVDYLKSFPEVIRVDNFILLMPQIYDYSDINLKRDLTKIQ